MNPHVPKVKGALIDKYELLLAEHDALLSRHLDGKKVMRVRFVAYIDEAGLIATDFSLGTHEPEGGKIQ